MKSTKNTTAKKNVKPAKAAKVAPAKKAAKVDAQPKGSAKQSMPAGKKAEITVAQLVKLLKDGKTVYTVGGVRHNLKYSQAVADQDAVRKVIIAA
jgi:hypothetical protein